LVLFRTSGQERNRNRYNYETDQEGKAGIHD